MEEAVYASVTYAAPCGECGAELECHGVQALVGRRLRWDVELVCWACGFELAVCGGDLPPERRAQLLARHGATALRVSGPGASAVAVLRVVRAELGLDLAAAKLMARRVLDGKCSGTLPEMERLARALRTHGVPATVAGQ
ncbi:hypothetical protein ABZ135_25230 [Streptomyces sp. NPDC006339]|uniref:hypothetical protein n=1 Tax=Streptomyces sp. NPDC006339 TaxID=3156755 RepID=UPI0033BA4792